MLTTKPTPGLAGSGGNWSQRLGNPQSPSDDLWSPICRGEQVLHNPSEVPADGGELGGLGGDSNKPKGDSRALWCLWGGNRGVHCGRRKSWVAPGTW